MFVVEVSGIHYKFEVNNVTREPGQNLSFEISQETASKVFKDPKSNGLLEEAVKNKILFKKIADLKKEDITVEIFRNDKQLTIVVEIENLSEEGKERAIEALGLRQLLLALRQQALVSHSFDSTVGAEGNELADFMRNQQEEQKKSHLSSSQLSSSSLTEIYATTRAAEQKATVLPEFKQDQSSLAPLPFQDGLAPSPLTNVESVFVALNSGVPLSQSTSASPTPPIQAPNDLAPSSSFGSARTSFPVTPDRLDTAIFSLMVAINDQLIDKTQNKKLGVGYERNTTKFSLGCFAGENSSKVTIVSPLEDNAIDEPNEKKAFIRALVALLNDVNAEEDTSSTLDAKGKQKLAARVEAATTLVTKLVQNQKDFNDSIFSTNNEAGVTTLTSQQKSYLNAQYKAIRAYEEVALKLTGSQKAKLIVSTIVGAAVGLVLGGLLGITLGAFLGGGVGSVVPAFGTLVGALSGGAIVGVKWALIGMGMGASAGASIALGSGIYQGHSGLYKHSSTNHNPAFYKVAATAKNFVNAENLCSLPPANRFA